MHTPAFVALLKRPALLAAIALTGVGVLVGALQLTLPAAPGAIPSPDKHARRLVVEVTVAKIRPSFDREIEFVGRIEAARESELSFERMGLVTGLLVDEGDSVTAGQVLGFLDTKKLAAERSVLVARLAAAGALLKELIAGPRAEDLKAQRAEVERLGYELKRIELSRDRNEQLLKRAATSRDQYEADLYSAQSTQAALDAASAKLEELENGTRDEKLEAQRAVVQQIEAEIESIDIDLSKSQLMAPFAGTIGNRMVDEGNVVAIGQTIVSLLEITRPELRVGVDTATAASLQLGMSIPVITSGVSTRGKIRVIRNDVAGRTRTVDVLISLQNQDCVYRSGDLATAKIAKSVPVSGVWLPMAALTEGTRGLWSVFVAEPVDDHYIIQRRDVEVLHTETARVFVRGAVADGDRVVVSGMHRLVPDLHVTVNGATTWE